ncbi:MAG: tyrosine-type recombinase/integrase [Patescibacteria group bacterium]|nr:tyrosine-type recombinase/integrase [Patescibacteria group bacterium]
MRKADIAVFLSSPEMSVPEFATRIEANARMTAALLLTDWTQRRVDDSVPFYEGEVGGFMSGETRCPSYPGTHQPAGQRLIEQLRGAIGTAKRITPHTLRHTTATLALTMGSDLSTVADLLRHSDLNTTRRYLHLVDERRREAVRRLGSCVPQEILPATPLTVPGPVAIVTVPPDAETVANSEPAAITPTTPVVLDDTSPPAPASKPRVTGHDSVPTTSTEAEIISLDAQYRLGDNPPRVPGDRGQRAPASADDAAVGQKRPARGAWCIPFLSEVMVSRGWISVQVVPPGVGAPRAPDPTFEVFESTRALAAAGTDFWRKFMLFLLHTGARFGEAAALMWDDLELDAVEPLVHIRRAAARGVLQSTKTGRMRDIPLNPTIVGALRAFPRTGPFVFQRHVDSFMDPGSTEKFLYRICRDAGIKPFGWHTFRHTFASNLTAAGVPIRVVQELLGHTTILMTARYSHVSRSTLRSAVDQLAALGAADKVSPHSSAGTDPTAPTRTDVDHLARLEGEVVT